MEIIGIIDYGSGNIHSATKAFENVAKDLKKEIKILRIQNAADIKLCDRIVLPGVGAFKDCKAGLVNIDGLVPTLEKKILDAGAPFLGICVGMQLLADIGFEGETTPGFGWIPGVVDKIPATAGLKIPHMGWNNIKFNREIHFVDTLRMAQLVLPFLDYHSMKSLSSYFNIINPNAHRAYEDADTLRKIYEVLKTLFHQKFNISKNVI